MAEEQIRRFSETTETLYALEGIRSKYPKIRSSSIEIFAPVYYPIAIMEMLLKEQTFEDFETVQLTVLQMIKWGLSDASLIAKTLGLSTSYTENVIRLLRGYGHITAKGITNLGLQSLSEGKKIVLTETRQKFQMDALMGTLLKLGENVLNNTLSEKEDTNKFIAHFNYPAGILEKDVVTQLAGDRCHDYLQHKSDIIHANVTDISDIKCKEIQYAKAYLLKLTGQQYPIIFAKRYDRNKKDKKDRFSWQPFSIVSSSLINTLGFEEDTYISSLNASEYTYDLYNMLIEKGREKALDGSEICDTVTRALPFRTDGLNISISSGFRTARVEVRPEAFTRYWGNLINFFTGIAKYGEYLIPIKQIGFIISIYVTDSRLKDLGKLISEKCDELGVQKVRDTLKDNFRDYTEELPLIDAMFSVVSNI